MFDYSDNSSWLGLADMCKAIRTGREYRATISNNTCIGDTHQFH